MVFVKQQSMLSYYLKYNYFNSYLYTSKAYINVNAITEETVNPYVRNSIKIIKNIISQIFKGNIIE